MKNEVWKYITFILVLVLGVFVTSTALLYLQTESVSNYVPKNVTCNVTQVENLSELTYLNARVAELESQLKAIELERKPPTVTNVSIAVVPIFGIITEDTALTTVSTLEKISKDESVGGILLWIESPGGDVGAVREIYQEVLTVKAKKPVVAYTGGIAASGGYYVALAADRIIADPLAEIGSIGVIYVHYNLEKNYNMNGITVDVFKTGPHKDMGAEWRDLSDYERKKIEKMVNTYFKGFLDAVMLSRNLSKNETMKYATGETWFATDVNGTLVDGLGNFHTALQELENLMGVEGAEIKMYQSPQSEYSIGSFGGTLLYLDPRYIGG